MTKEKPSGLQRQPKAGDGKQPERDEQLGKSILEMKLLETRGCEVTVTLQGVVEKAW